MSELVILICIQYISADKIKSKEGGDLWQVAKLRKITLQMASASSFTALILSICTDLKKLFECCREVDMFGGFRYRNTYPLCLELLSTRKVDVRPLITHHYGFTLDEVVEAFHKGAKDKSAVKIMFHL